MEIVKYSNKTECQKAIDTVRALGMEPTKWMLDQLEAFETVSQSGTAQNGATSDEETPIWNTLQQHYPYGEMPQEKKDCVESTVEQLLEGGEHAEEPGLLLGKIQCGKTDTFEDIIGLAFDKGVDVAIVITKGTKALVNQTIMRMKKDYRWFKESDELDARATINIYDIMGLGKSGLKQAKVEGRKTVIVCKKQARNMERLIELFEEKSPFLKQKKVIVVDDEADFASRNYRSVRPNAVTDAEGNPVAQTAELTMAKISQQIDDFRKIPDFCRYLQVTATPYCLYLQPDGELNLNGNVVKPFKPRFTQLVPTHDAYVGGEEYFVKSANGESMYSHLYHQLDQKCVDVLGHEDKRYLTNASSSGNIYGLTYALTAYFMATAVRRIQVREVKNRDYKTSAIIHVEVSKKNHEWQQRVVERLIGSIQKAVLEDDRSDIRVWVAMEAAYRDFAESNRKGRAEGLIGVELPSQEAVLEEMRLVLDPNVKNYHVQMVNSDEEMSSLLDEESGELSLDCAANIFIGGNILDRGVTIKNMLCFFYGRDPKNFQQDTVLQHARMYGARSKEDMAVMRLHTTPYIYKALVRMNELDDQLRQWFTEGHDKLDSNAVFVGYDQNIKPCSPTKIKASNALMLKPQKRMLPVGFWTGTKTATKKTVEQIREMITSSAHYGQKDENGFFEMDKDSVVEALKLIETTYVYSAEMNNADRKNDMKELRCALEYCTVQSGGKIWALHRENRNMTRIRENGGFIDAPDDGHTDGAPSRAKAVDAPVVMFLQQNGEDVRDENGERIGWRGAPFYWPVLMTQQNMPSVMFALDQKAKGQTAVVDNSDFLDGIDPKEVLSMTYQGDLEDHFGEEGSTYETDECPIETRSVKATTASRFLQKDSAGDYLLNPAVTVDQEHFHGVYSLNGGVFPFVLRPYRYMCLRNGRDARADMMLLELFGPEKWKVLPSEDCIDENGDLRDRETDAVLMHTRDTLIDRQMKEHDFDDDTVTQWIIEYSIKKVLKLKKCTIDWDAVFGDEEEEE